MGIVAGSRDGARPKPRPTSLGRGATPDHRRRCHEPPLHRTYARSPPCRRVIGCLTICHSAYAKAVHEEDRPQCINIRHLRLNSDHDRSRGDGRERGIWGCKNARQRRGDSLHVPTRAVLGILVDEDYAGRRQGEWTTVDPAPRVLYRMTKVRRGASSV
jgi:hypothetical protein